MKKPIKLLYGNPDDMKQLLGLGYEVISIDEWHHEPNTNYLAVGDYCYSEIRKNVPLGLRGASFWMAASMNRVGLNDGSNYVFSWPGDFYIQEALKKFDDPNFETPHPLYKIPPFEWITDIDRALDAFKEFTELPVGTWFGYDYESKSFPDQADFILTGLGIATVDKMVFIDYRFCMSTPRANHLDYLKEGNEDENLNKLNKAHREFLEKHDKHCIVFNVNFELQATYRYLGDFFRYRDLNVTNIMDMQGIWCNLKWTSRKNLNINSWDDKFEEFNSAFSRNDESELPVCELNDDDTIYSVNYENIKKRFNWISMSDIKEMMEHEKVCRNSFYMIPGRHLGYYCGLDCYNTLMSWLIQLDRWDYVESDDDYEGLGDKIAELPMFPIEDRFNLMHRAALDIYCDGKIAESIVNNGGQLVDTKFWRYGRHMCHSVILHAATHLGVYYCDMYMRKLTDRNDINQYSKSAQFLITQGIDVTQGGYYISKGLFNDRYYDESYDGYCNVDKVYQDWGDEIGQELIDCLWSYVDTLEGSNRKRGVWTALGEILDRELSLSEELLEKHEATVQYYYYLRTKEWYQKLPWYNTPLNEFKEEYTFEGQTQDLIAWHQYLASIINVNTTQWEMTTDVIEHNDTVWKYSGVLVEGWDYKLYDHYKRESLEKDMEFFYSEDAMQYLDQESVENIQRIFEREFDEYGWKHLFCIASLKDSHPKDFKEILHKIMIGDVSDGVHQLFVCEVLLRMWAKYFKIMSYFQGLYYDANCNYHTLDKYWMRDFVPFEKYDEDHNVLAFPEFQANSQFSYRWSSNFHTVPSKSEVKKCTSSPEDSVFTYFDISSMEIRSIAYLAGDKAMTDLFEQKIDLYKYCAKFMLGEEVWNSLDDYSIGEYRTEFKVVLLAYFYLRGARSLAPELGKTVEETQAIMDSLAKTFPDAIKFRDYLSNYPVYHEGRLLTAFGETIISDEEKYRQQKHGINTVIQSSSAVMLVYGFYHLMRETWKQGWKFRSVGYVHDSSQSYFDIDHFWEMREHYYKHVTQFLYDRFRILFEFDIMVGTNYYEVAKLSQPSDDVVQLKGCANCINSIMQRLRKRGHKFEILDSEKLDLDENGYLKPEVMDPYEDFITSNAHEAIFLKDHSSYTVQLKKL